MDLNNIQPVKSSKSPFICIIGCGFILFAFTLLLKDMNRSSSSLSAFDIILIFAALILTIVGGWLFYLQNRRDLEITKQKIEVYLRQKEFEHSEKMAKKSNEQERILNDRERLQREKSIGELPSQNQDVKP